MDNVLNTADGIDFSIAQSQTIVNEFHEIALLFILVEFDGIPEILETFIK